MSMPHGAQASPPSLFALSAATLTRYNDGIDGLDEDIGLRVELAARQLVCVSPHCQNNPEEKKCGLCLLPLCNACNAAAQSCDGCGVTVCQLCALPEDAFPEAHAKHHQLWDLAGGGRPLFWQPRGRPPPVHCYGIDCATCGKSLCWYCWQALAADHNPENAAWMCDSCNSSLCLDCVFVVDAVGLPKLAHDFKDVDVNVICHGCLKADRGRYRLRPNHNINAFEEDGEEDVRVRGRDGLVRGVWGVLQHGVYLLRALWHVRGSPGIQAVGGRASTG